MSLAPSDILDNARYESVRAEYRARLMAHKAERRVAVGDRVSLCFEDRETVRYQIQEMARVERLTAPERIAHEIAVYSELLPSERELCATLFIEIPDAARIRSELDRLLGIDECVVLAIGDGDEARRVTALFDDRQLEADRISAVHYLRFPLDPGARSALLAGAAARIEIDHPAYRAAAPLSDTTRASLCRDLTGATPRLLDPAAVPEAEGDRVLSEDDRVRVVEPARKARAHHYRVEARDPGATLLDCDAALLAALFEAARHLSRDLAARGIASQIVANQPADAGAGAPASVAVLSVDPA